MLCQEGPIKKDRRMSVNYLEGEPTGQVKGFYQKAPIGAD